MNPSLNPLESGGGLIEPIEQRGWHFSIPAGPDRAYRLAQMDDYRRLIREKFLWQPPVTLSLNVRVSEPELLGTWGFGLWNDPFAISFGLGGANRRIPALPNTAWFFFASPPNYLSIRDDLPTRGLLAATFRSPRLPSALLALSALGIPLLFWRPLARKIRSTARRWIKQSASLVNLDLTSWRHYTISWQNERTLFQVDDQVMLDTPISPFGPLGLVMWIDNQYAAFTPRGSFVFGTLPNPRTGWLEITDIQIG